MFKEELPLISIITPSFNQGRFIHVTLDSVLAKQDYRNFEHIIFDGGSMDNTLDILKKYKSLYPNKLNYNSEPDKGQSNAINKGFKIAKGEIIGWINSDDYYEDNIFQFVIDFFSENPAIDMIYGGCNRVDEYGKFIEKFEDGYGFKICRVTNYNEFNYDILLNTYSGLIPQQSVFFRKRILDTVGYLDESYEFTMDYEYWLRIGSSCKIKRVNKVLANFRTHKAAKTNLKNINSFVIESLKARSKYGGKLFATFYLYIGLIVSKTLIKQILVKLRILK